MPYELTLEQKHDLLNRLRFELQKMPATVDEAKLTTLSDNRKYPDGTAPLSKYFHRSMVGKPKIIGFPKKVKCAADVVCDPKLGTMIYLELAFSPKLHNPPHENQERDETFAAAIGELLKNIAEKANLEKKWIPRDEGDYEIFRGALSDPFGKHAKRILGFTIHDRDKVLESLDIMLKETELAIQTQTI